MNKQAQSLVDDLGNIMNKVDDIQSIYDGYQEDEKLNGIYVQAEFMVDCVKTNGDTVYSNDRRAFEIDLLEREGKESKENAEGRRLVEDFINYVADYDDVFIGYPSDEQLSLRSSMLLEEEHRDLERSVR